MCSREVMRVLLEPFLLHKRRLFIKEKNAMQEKTSEGCQANDMLAFMKGESWEELVERIKPPEVPWLLFTELRKNQEMIHLIEDGLMEQIRIDDAMEVKKLQLI